MNIAHRPVRFLLLGLSLMSCAAAVPARRATDGARAIVFKDGYALIIKTYSAVTDEQGRVHIDEVPDAAVLGSFWATSKQGRLVSIHAGFKDVAKTWQKTTTAVDHLDLISANVGHKLEVRYADGVTYAGKIEAVLAHDREVADPDETGVVVRKLSGHSFVLRTADGAVVLSTSGIRSLKLDKLETKIVRLAKQVERRKRLTLRFEKPNQRRDITLTYFRPGVRWIPTYRLDLHDNGKADLSMQAELINEAEDLTGLPIDIVVGVPNFRFKDTVSPLVLEARLTRTLAQAAPQLMGQMASNFSNASYGQRSTEHRAASAQPAQAELPGELSSSSNHDLFVYSLPAMELAKGERVAVSVFRRTVPYRHVYTWDLHLKQSTSGRAPSAAGVTSPLDLSKNEVWHQIELTNDTKEAWTTGAIMLMDGRQPLAQELLTYTSRGDRVRVPVTISVETRGTISDGEEGRKLGAMKWDGHSYAQLDHRATLSLCNHKATAVDVEIALQHGGRATEASDAGKITLAAHRADDWTRYVGSPAVNNSSTVRWKRRLKPGEVFEPTVDYRYFTRH